MRLPTFRLVPVTFFAGSALLSVLAGCGAARTVSYTYTKPNAAEAALVRDEQDLRHTSGVENVITRIDSSNTATIVLYLNEDDLQPGQQKILELGYQRVRN